MGEVRFIFNDFVTLRTVVWPSLGSYAASSYSIMLPLGERLVDVSSSVRRDSQFIRDFVEEDCADVQRTIENGRIVYLYNARLPVEVHVLAQSEHDVDNLCPLIDRVAMVYDGPTLELRQALSSEDAERLLTRMEFLIDAHAKA